MNKYIRTSLLLCLLLINACSSSSPDQKDKRRPDRASQQSFDTIARQTEREYYAEEMHYYTFARFPSDSSIPPATIALPDLSTFRNMPEDIVAFIRKDYSIENPNFNSTYKIVSWSCGSPCQMVAVFDSRTGKIIDTFSTSAGADYRLSSRLLVLNPPGDIPVDSTYRTIIGRPQFWELRSGRLFKLR